MPKPPSSCSARRRVVGGAPAVKTTGRGPQSAVSSPQPTVRVSAKAPGSWQTPLRAPTLESRVRTVVKVRGPHCAHCCPGRQRKVPPIRKLPACPSEQTPRPMASASAQVLLQLSNANGGRGGGGGCGEGEGGDGVGRRVGRAVAQRADGRVVAVGTVGGVGANGAGVVHRPVGGLVPQRAFQPVFAHPVDGAAAVVARHRVAVAHLGHARATDPRLGA